MEPLLLFDLEIRRIKGNVGEHLVRGHIPIIGAARAILRFLRVAKIVMPGKRDSVVGLEITEALLDGIPGLPLIRSDQSRGALAPGRGALRPLPGVHTSA